MSKDYSEAYLELQIIRKEMAEIDDHEAIMRIASAVQVLAFHIQKLMEAQR